MVGNTASKRAKKKLKERGWRLYVYTVEMYLCVQVLLAGVKSRDAQRETATEHKRSGPGDEMGRGVGGIDSRDEKSSSLYPTVCCLSSLQGVQWHTVNGIFKGGPRRERLSPAYRNQKA